MALGHSSPDQVNPGPGRSIAQTGLEDQTQHLRRDYQKDREDAIRAQIAAYTKEGRDTSHLKATLGRKPENATGHEASARADGPAHLDPRKGEFSPPGEVYSPVPESVREPEDSSAPDKREQDQSPVPVKGGGENVVTAKNPGPEAPKRKDPHLPDQVNPNLEVPEIERTVSGAGPETVPALPDQEPQRDRDEEEPVELAETDVQGGGKLAVKAVGPIASEAGGDDASTATGPAKQTTPPSKKAETKKSGRAR